MDYLSGASPLNMTMKLGEYVMLVQLRLDQVEPRSEKKPSSHSDQSACGQTISGSEDHLTPSSELEDNVPSQRGGDPRPKTVEFEKVKSPQPKRPKLDPKALTAASKDLIQTLQRIISQVKDLPPVSLVEKSGGSEDSQRGEKENSGSKKEEELPMLGPLKNHGKGIYGGTFAGPLGSAVLDQGGLPVPNTGTIVHILRDLLKCAFKSFGEARDAAAKPEKTSKTKKETNPEARLDTIGSNLSKEQKEATRLKMENLRKQIAEKRARRKERHVKSL